MKMPICQSAVMKHLDTYLKTLHSSIKLNEKGNCNGFSHVFAKYCLEGRKDEYFDLLEYICNNPVELYTDEVNQFLTELFLTAGPEQFNQSLTQRHAYKTLSIEGEPLHSPFSFSIVTEDKNWETLFNEIKLNEYEAIIVSGQKHAITITREGGNYLVYDCNYRSGSKLITTVEQLIQELRIDCFAVKGSMGLSLRVLQHPQKMRDMNLDEASLYKRFLSAENINIAADLNSSESQSSLEMMFLYCDNITIEELDLAFKLATPDLNRLCKLLEISAGLNVTFEKIEFISLKIEEYLEKNYNEPQNIEKQSTEHDLAVIIKEMESLIASSKASSAHRICLLSALLSGREGLFDKFFEKEWYKNIIANKSLTYDDMLTSTAKSGNSSLFNKVLCFYNNERELSSQITSDLSLALIDSAIEGGSLDCLNMILDELGGNTHILSDDKLLNYLSRAIHSNNLPISKKLIQLIPEERRKLLNFPLSVIERTVLPILKLLKENEIPFSANAEYLFRRKEHKSVNILSWILVVLEQIKDYFLYQQIISFKDRSVYNKSRDTGMSIVHKLSIFKNVTTGCCVEEPIKINCTNPVI